jgi:hypothetical protein
VVGYSETCIHHFLRDCGKKIIKAGKPQLQISFNGIGFMGTTTNEHYLGEKNAQGGMDTGFTVLFCYNSKT